MVHPLKVRAIQLMLAGYTKALQDRRRAAEGTHAPNDQNCTIPFRGDACTAAVLDADDSGAADEKLATYQLTRALNNHHCFATGYMVARMLGSAPTIADTIIEQLAAPFDKAYAAKVCSLQPLHGAFCVRCTAPSLASVQCACTACMHISSVQVP